VKYTTCEKNKFVAQARRCGAGNASDVRASKDAMLLDPLKAKTYLLSNEGQIIQIIKRLRDYSLTFYTSFFPQYGRGGKIPRSS